MWVWNELPKLQQLALNKGHFWKSGANLSCYHFMFEHEPKQRKFNFSFHWNLKGDRALILTDLDSPIAIFDFGYLGANWSQSCTKNSNFG